MSDLYGGNPFASDFEAELPKPGVRERIWERAKVRLAPETDPLFLFSVLPVPPTPEGLQRHAEKFGMEAVQEVADMYGVDLTARTEIRRPQASAWETEPRRTSLVREALAVTEEAQEQRPEGEEVRLRPRSRAGTRWPRDVTLELVRGCLDSPTRSRRRGHPALAIQLSRFGTRTVQQGWL
jgi:hypothetical protein